MADSPRKAAADEPALSQPFVYEQSEHRLESGELLSDRIIAALADADITSAESLAALTEAQLLRLPGIGRGALTRIQAFLGNRRADANIERAHKVKLIKAILAEYLDPCSSERAACEIAEIL